MSFLTRESQSCVFWMSLMTACSSLHLVELCFNFYFFLLLAIPFISDSLIGDVADGNIRIWKDYAQKSKQILVTAFSSIQGPRPGVRTSNAVVDWQQHSGCLVNTPYKVYLHYRGLIMYYYFKCPIVRFCWGISDSDMGFRQGAACQLHSISRDQYFSVGEAQYLLLLEVLISFHPMKFHLFLASCSLLLKFMVVDLLLVMWMVRLGYLTSAPQKCNQKWFIYLRFIGLIIFATWLITAGWYLESDHTHRALKGSSALVSNLDWIQAR